MHDSDPTVRGPNEAGRDAPGGSSERGENGRLVAELEERLERYSKSGSEEAIARQHAKKKLTVHERLDILFDPGERRFEVGTFAAMGMYEEHGDILSAGVRTVIGTVSGRDAMVIANDSMVKSGTWFPLTIEKILRAQEIAIENSLPVIYLVDSGGLFLPLQSESFPGRDHAGRIFFYNARLSAMGVPQIAAVVGPCVAGGAYIPALCDELLMVEGTSGIYLAGPYLVRAAIGERVDSESLGGASTHNRLSGMADYKDPDDRSCLERVRRLAAQWPSNPAGSYLRSDPEDPEHSAKDVLDVLPADRRSPYDMRAILLRVVDRGSLEEYKAEYGTSLVTATARIDGRAVGIVASQRLNTTSGRGEVQIGGVVYGDAASKAARFVLDMNQKKIPLVFFQDVVGFMVGSRAEAGGIIKDGAKLVNAVSNSRVPKVTVIIGNSYGAGNYALCGRAFGPRFLVAWPTARIAVMGGEQAAETIRSIQKAKADARTDDEKGDGGGGEEEIEKEKVVLARIRASYEETASPYHAAARLRVDAVIDPRRTREVLAHLLRIACRSEPELDFKLGVFQV